MQAEERLTTRAQYIVLLAAHLSESNEVSALEPLYVLYAILLLHKCTAMQILINLGAEREKLEKAVKTEIANLKISQLDKGVNNTTKLQQKQTTAVLKLNDLYDSELGIAIGTENLLLGIANISSIAQELLENAGITSVSIKDQIRKIIGGK